MQYAGYNDIAYPGMAAAIKTHLTELDKSINTITRLSKTDLEKKGYCMVNISNDITILNKGIVELEVICKYLSSQRSKQITYDENKKNNNVNNYQYAKYQIVFGIILNKLSVKMYESLNNNQITTDGLIQLLLHLKKLVSLTLCKNITFALMIAIEKLIKNTLIDSKVITKFIYDINEFMAESGANCNINDLVRIAQAHSKYTNLISEL